MVQSLVKTYMQIPLPIKITQPNLITQLIEPKITMTFDTNKQPALITHNNKLTPIYRDGQIYTNKFTNSTDNAALYTNGDIHITSKKLINQDKASLSATTLNFKNNQDGNEFINKDSLIQLNDIDWQLAEFDNSKGWLVGKNSVAIHADRHIDNTQGTIASKGNIDLISRGYIDNHQGNIQSEKKLIIQGSRIDNQQGNISSGSNLSLDSKGALNNHSGDIISQNNAHIDAQDINNYQGNITAQAKLKTQSHTLNNSGQIYGKYNTTITANDDVSNSGIIASGDNTQISSHNFYQNSTGKVIAGMSPNGSLGSSNANLNITANNQLISRGQHIATGQLNLDAKQLDITGSHSQAHNINVATHTGDLNLQSATLTATGSLNLTAPSGSLNNQKGHLSAGSLSLRAQALNNTDGRITQIGSTPLTLNMQTGINNSRGQISSNSNTLNINTTELTNTQGIIHHAGEDSLNITAKHVDNNKGQILSSGKQTWQISDKIDNKAGIIQANHYDIVANVFDNTQGKVVAISPNQGQSQSNQSQIQLKGDLNNTQGMIGSNTGSLSIHSLSLDNTQGKITSQKELLLTNERLNNSGSLYAIKDAIINTTNHLQNTGSIASGHHLNIHSNSFQQTADGKLIAGLNSDGNLQDEGNLNIINTSSHTNAGLNLAAGDLQIQADKLNLTDSHNQSQNLSLTATGDINLSNANTLATKTATLNSDGTLITNKGTLQAESFDFHINSLSNRKGTLTQTGQKALAIQTKGDIDNQQGSIGGQADSITLHSDATINNQSGHIVHVGTGTANIQAAQFNNQQGDLLSSGKLTGNIHHTTNNNQGIIQAASISYQSKELNNINGRILTQTGDLTLNTERLNNQGKKATIQSGKSLYLNDGQLNNQDHATISANNDLSINNHGINNSTDSIIASNQALTIQTTTLNNNAQIASLQDNTNITTDTLNNQAEGQIQAKQNIKLTASQNINNQGIVSTDKDIVANAGQTLNNHSGTLLAANIAIDSHGLNNQSGVIGQTQADGHLIINNHQGTLNNQNSQSTTTKQRGIIATGDSQIKTGSLNNQAGQITANKQLGIFAQQGSINNSSGHITATDVQLTADNGQIQNDTANSLIQASNNLTIKTSTLSNQNNRQTGGGTKTQGIIAGNELNIHANTLNNSSGQLLANSLIHVNANGQINNQSGDIQSHNIRLQDDSSNHSLNINNNSGHIKADETILFDGAHLSTDYGSIEAKKVNIKATDDLSFNSDNAITTNNLDIETKGSLTTNGILSSKNTLTIHANRIDNGRQGSLVSEGKTSLTANNIYNRGLINGADTYLQATDGVHNYSYGRIYGNHVAIEANTLNNTPEGSGYRTLVSKDACQAAALCVVQQQGNDTQYYMVTSDPAPVIAARQRLDIGVTTLNNNPNAARAGIFNKNFSGRAKIISNGSLHIGGHLNSSHQAAGTATTVNNLGASIESIGNMDIHAQALNNKNADFKTAKKELSRKNITKYNPENSLVEYNEDEVTITSSGRKNRIHDMIVKNTNQTYAHYDKHNHIEILRGEKTITSDPSRILSGGDITFNLGSFNTSKSQIIAGGQIQTTGKASNIEPEPTSVVPVYTYQNAKVTYYKRKKNM